MKSLKTREAAEVLNLREHEVRALGDEGKIKSYRTEGNHRRYCYDSVYEYKKKILGSESKDVIIYMLMNEEQSEAKVLKLCEMLGWKYILLKERENECFESSEFKKLIDMIKGNETKKVLVSSLDKIGETKYNFIKEISGYHGVQVVALSELQRELEKDV